MPIDVDSPRSCHIQTMRFIVCDIGVWRVRTVMCVNGLSQHSLIIVHSLNICANNNYSLRFCCRWAFRRSPHRLLSHLHCISRQVTFWRYSDTSILAAALQVNGTEWMRWTVIVCITLISLTQLWFVVCACIVLIDCRFRLFPHWHLIGLRAVLVPKYHW